MLRLKGKVKGLDHRKGSNRSNIDVLPSECWRHVFSFLPIEDKLNVKKVSDNWRDIILSLLGTLNTIDLIQLPQLNNELIEILQCCGDVLEKVVIPLSYGCTALAKILLYCFQLKRITVVFEDHLDLVTRYRTLSVLFQQNQKLEAVALYNVGKDFHRNCFCLLELPETLIRLELWAFKANRIWEPLRWLPFTYYKNCDTVLQKFRYLRCLKLYGFTLNISHMRALESMRHLEILEIYDCDRQCNVDVITRLTRLVELRLFFVKAIDEDWFTNLTANCKNLQFLTFKCCPVTDANIAKLSELENLEWLRLDQVISSINGEGFANLRSMRVFTCCGNPDVNDSSIMRLLEVAPNLRYMDLRGSGVTSRTVEFANMITKKRLNNVMLHIRVDPKHSFAWSIDVSIHTICKGWKNKIHQVLNLKCFDLSKYGQYNDQVLLNIAHLFSDNESRLREIELSGTLAANIAPGTVTRFFKILNLHTLTSLNISGLNICKSTMRQLADKLICLNEFCIGEYPNNFEIYVKKIIVKNELKAFAIVNNRRSRGEFFSTLIQSTSLISFTAIKCYNFNSSLLSDWLQTAKSLNHLKISKCKGIMNHVESVVAETNIYKHNIKSIYLESDTFTEYSLFNDLSTLPGKNMSSQLEDFKNLTELYLLNVAWVTEELMYGVAKSRIKHLDLSGCRANQGWWRPFRNAHSLISLSINNMKEVAENPIFQDDQQALLDDMFPVIMENLVPDTFEDFYQLRNKLEKLEMRDYNYQKLPREIIAFLEFNTTLKELDLRNWRIEQGTGTSSSVKISFSISIE